MANSKPKKNLEKIKSTPTSEILPGKVSEDKNHHNIRVSSSILAGITNLPPAHIVKELEKLVPGAAKNIMTGYLKQGDHRRYIEKENTDTENKLKKTGIWLGFIFSVLMLVVIALAIIHNNTIVATTLSAILLGVLAIFVLRRLKSSSSNMLNVEENNLSKSKDKKH